MSNLYGKSKSKKLTEIDPKYFPPKPIDHVTGKEIPFAETPQMIEWIIRYSENAKQREKETKLEAKRREEELKRMEAYEKQQRELSKRQQALNSQIPERQFNMLLSGKYPRYQFGNYSIPMYPAFVGVPSKIHQQEGHPVKIISIDAAMNYLRKKWPLMIELDEQTHNRLVDFAKPDELYTDLINRLLDIAASAEAEATTQQQ
jgi:hypothetical protein